MDSLVGEECINYPGLRTINFHAQIFKMCEASGSSILVLARFCSEIDFDIQVGFGFRIDYGFV